MKLKITLLLSTIQLFCFSQNLKLEPYIFISKQKDSVNAELGKFKVLENRNKASSDSIELSFIRFKSTSSNPGHPIIYLAGGPGGSGTGAAKGNRFSLFMKLRAVADVIAFDQRSTGLSQRLPNCPYSAKFEIDLPIEKSVYVEKTVENINECRRFWNEKNIDLRAYNTIESAKDIDDLRRVLDTEKISILGISYGSHLAFEYIRHYENSIDKLVLSSLEGPNETIKLPEDTETFVFELAKRANNNYGASKTYPNLKEKIIKVHERLEANPIITTYQNRRGTIDTVGISNFELQSTIATFYLKNPSDSKKLPKLYSEMYDGNFNNIASDVVIMKKYVLNSISGMSFSMDMQSSISEERKVKVDNQIEHAILGSTVNFLLFEWMKTLNYPVLPNSFRVLKENSVNALLFSGTLDGRTYVNSGIEISKKFKNGSHIIVDNAGHDLFMVDPKIGELIVEFFNGEKPQSQKIVIEPLYFD